MKLSRLTLAAFCAAFLWAQPKPDFSGVWTLNSKDSVYADKRTRPPDRLTWTLRQQGEHIFYKVESERAGKTNEFEADADIGGQAFESNAAGIIKFQWSGNNLAVDTLYNPGKDRESSISEIWTLSGDGKRLTDTVVYHPPKTAKDNSDVHFSRVFDKQ